MLELRMKDVNLNKNVVTLRTQSSTYKLRDDSGKIISRKNDIGRLKTDDSKRDLPISNLWCKVLVERIETLKERNDPDLLKPDAFIFCNKHGEMRTYSGTRSIFVRFMQKIDLHEKGYTLHSFRHSFVSHCKASGMDKESVTRYVGHASSKITDRIYTHLTQEEKLKITGAIDKAFVGLQ